MMASDPTIARVMKNQGYRTGQFGKNHLGDRSIHRFLTLNYGGPTGISP
jgi:arylsulfatase A-like enzyme